MKWIKTWFSLHQWSLLTRRCASGLQSLWSINNDAFPLCPTVGLPPPLHLHIHTLTVPPQPPLLLLLPLLTYTHTRTLSKPLWKFPWTRRIFYCWGTGLCRLMCISSGLTCLKCPSWGPGGRFTTLVISLLCCPSLTLQTRGSVWPSPWERERERALYMKNRCAHTLHECAY